MGSSRLPNKMMMPFYKDLSLLEVILKSVKILNEKYKVIVATSDQPIDNVIENCVINNKLSVFRGSESDVLKRFIDAAEEHGIDVVIRICADNPFISYKYILTLIEEFEKNSTDYLSFKNNLGVPVIKTHYGFFSEIVKVSALKKIANYTNELFFHEHVTNYIYTHPDNFQIKLIDIPFKENGNVRLTIDTFKDFELTQKIYSQLIEQFGNVDPENVMRYLEKHPEYLEIMKEQIQLQQK